MKKMIFSLMIVLGLSFSIGIKAEEVVDDTPSTEIDTTQQEEKTEFEQKLDEIQAKLERIENGITADDIDNSTPVKWLENKLGISLQGLGAFLLGSITALLLLIKVARSLSKLIDKDNKLSSQALEELNQYSKDLLEYKDKLDKVVENNNNLNAEFKKSWTEVSQVLANLNEFLQTQQSAFQDLNKLLEGSNEE